MIITKGGIVIRMALSQVKIAGRNTQGVRLIRLDEGQEISSIAVVPHEEEENIEELEKTEFGSFTDTIGVLDKIKVYKG